MQNHSNPYIVYFGPLPRFLLQNVNIPSIYAPNQAYALIKKKLADRNINYKGLRSYKSEDKLKYKNFEIARICTQISVLHL